MIFNQYDGFKLEPFLQDTQACINDQLKLLNWIKFVSIVLVRFQECDFVKLRNDSYLRVVYMGNLRLTGCSGCCKRWYFTFNNTECQTPAAIDASLYQGGNLNIHRPANIEGYCGAMPVGEVRVGFNVGNCGGGFSSNGDAWTSWNQANRIIIEEVDPPVD